MFPCDVRVVGRDALSFASHFRDVLVCCCVCDMYGDVRGVFNMAEKSNDRYALIG